MLFFLFPFVFLYLIFAYLQKLGSTPEDYRSNSKVVRILACILIFMGIIYMIAGLTGNLQTDDPNNVVFGIIVMLLICCGGGIGMLIYCKICGKFAALYEKYVPCILGSKTESIDQIASMVGVSYDAALESLNKLIGHGALKDAYIDHQRRKLVLPESKESASPIFTEICPHCGGACKVSDPENALCEYCNMPLK